MNIVSWHDAAGPDGQRVVVRSGLGMSRSDFSAPGVLAQQHVLAFNTGSNTRSAGLGLAFGSMGAFIPGADSREVSANGDVRLIGSHSSLTATARFFSERAGVGTNPLLAAFSQARGPVQPDRGDGTRWRASMGSPRLPGDSGATMYAVSPGMPQSVREYTLGTTGTFTPDARWTHSLTAGVDGYRLSDVAFDSGPIPSATDSALRAARGSADRLTLRASSVARFGNDATTSTTLTFAAEQSVLREATTADQPPGTPVSALESAAWRQNTGLIAQANIALRDALFFTGGLRVDRNDGYTTAAEVTALPLLGVAAVREIGNVTLKLRAAYGKGIRPPRTSSREASWMTWDRVVGSSSLSPEEQSGIEAGADLMFGKALSLHLTRFDQTASGLIQAVAVNADASTFAAHATVTPSHRVAYQLQNVGEIRNRGWEAQGTAQRGPLALTGALSLVDSRVERVTAGYTGDLIAGDRMLEVPARTATLTATWVAATWSSSWSLARASDWINYDRLAMAEALSLATRGPSELVGPRLRSFWRDYGGVTRLRATLARELSRGLTLVGTGENLLNEQRGEPDNATVIPGRTVSLGVKVRF